MKNQPGSSLYLDFTRAEWAGLRAATPLTLTELELAALRSFNEQIALEEVRDIYLPISRLLNLSVAATQQLHQTTYAFLGSLPPKVPFLIGLAGSVAVGKSTTARLLQALLSQWPDHPRVDLVTTDGFLFPNAVLEARGLMQRKGFPESYDTRRLIRFVTDIKAGHPRVTAPIYSHLVYDIVPEQFQTVERPDILILEGLNVLQRRSALLEETPRVFVSDFFDFSLYVDAAEADIRRWFIERFFRLRETAFQDTTAFFHHFAQLSEEEARQIAEQVWEEINGVNLRENIAPTRERANLILEKGPDHAVQRVRLRKL